MVIIAVASRFSIQNKNGQSQKAQTQVFLRDQFEAGPQSNAA